MKNYRIYLMGILILACCCAAALHAVEGTKGFNLWDEGFLWYGVQRVMAGETPIRDFMAYDPGRYYSSAFLMRLFGDESLMGLRASLIPVQVAGLFTGLWLAGRAAKDRGAEKYLFALAAAVILAAWMIPRHKMFDVCSSIFLLGLLARLIRDPRSRNYFLTGLGVGVIACIGRNHGVYGAAGSLGTIVWLGARYPINAPDGASGLGFLKGVLLWACGAAAGFSPILVMAVAIPGFAAAFIQSIQLMFEQGSTNLPLPIPWPWTVKYPALPVGEAARGLLAGCFFLAMPLFGVSAIAYAVRQRLRGAPVEPALAASAFLSLPYMHYAFSRADVGHLALGIFPLLTGLLVIFAAMKSRLKWPLTAALCAASLWGTLDQQPGWNCLGRGECVSMKISGRELMGEPWAASDAAMLRDLAQKYAPEGRAFLVTPFWPGAYALLERRSPMLESFALFRRNEAFEEKEIERIRSAHPAFVLIFDFALDGRDELRFKNTHPLIHRYVLDNFERAPDALNPAYQLFIPRVGAR
jgi:hypothetical protein